MIDMSPKALRFARLAAEEMPAFSGDPCMALIKKAEGTFVRRGSGDRTGRYVAVSDRTADFCMRAVAAFLGEPGRFRAPDWDENDHAFFKEVERSLREQLLTSNAPTL